MLEKIAEAIEIQDYSTASQLLEELMKSQAHNPWVDFYQARLDEAKGNFQAADGLYRQLLHKTTNPKVLARARQGVQRLANIEAKQREAALAQATAEPDSEQLGVLILEPIGSEKKKAAAVELARIANIDPYTARLQLPTRNWRLYRTGKIGELKYYTNALREAEIPCFCTAIKDIETVNVYQVRNFIANSSQVALEYINTEGRIETYSFDWSEVSQRVEGLLPLFEESLQTDMRGKFYRKTKILDYAQFCDLHLPQTNSILRLSDRTYDFLQGMNFSESRENVRGRQQTTTREKWNNLIEFLHQSLPDIPVYSGFTPFAEGAMDWEDMLDRIQPHINLFRREETPWDAAFQLYSSLILLRIIVGTRDQL